MAGHCSIFCDVFWDLVCVDLIDLINTRNTWSYKINMLQLGWNCGYFHQNIEEMQSLSWGGDFEGVKCAIWFIFLGHKTFFPHCKMNLHLEGVPCLDLTYVQLKNYLTQVLFSWKINTSFGNGLKKKCLRPILLNITLMFFLQKDWKNVINY